MATTDYDAPRRNTVEDANTESLDANTTARQEAQSPDVDLDQSDTAEGVELPGADLSVSGEELTMPVIPRPTSSPAFALSSSSTGATNRPSAIAPRSRSRTRAGQPTTTQRRDR